MAIFCLRQGVAKKPLRGLAFAFGIGAHEMIEAGAAAVQSNQVKARNRTGVGETIRAQDARAFACGIEGDEIVHGPGFTAVERNGRALLRTWVKMSQGGFQCEAAVGIDPSRRDLVHVLVDVSIQRG